MPEEGVSAPRPERDEARLAPPPQPLRADSNAEAPKPPPPIADAEEFELGVHGYVHSRDGSAVAGAQVSVSVGAPWMTPKRWRATTDESGHWSVRPNLHQIMREAYSKRRRDRRAVRKELSAKITNQLREAGYAQELSDAELARLTSLAQPLGDSHWAQPLRLEVSARASKLEQASRSLALLADVSERLRIDLILEELWDFTGETIFHGMGLRNANVLLFTDDWKYTAATLSDLDGHFHFRTPEPGRFRIHARKLGIGAGSTAGIYLGGPFAAPEIVVPIDGEWEFLHGRLVLPDGEPLPGVQVVAVEEGLALSNPESPTYPKLSDLAQAEASGGLALSRARTREEDGLFLMPAMQPGAYLLELVGFDNSHQPRETYLAGVENRIVLDVNLLKVVVKTRRGELPLGLRVHVEELPTNEIYQETPGRHRSLAAISGSAAFIIEPNKAWHVWASNGTEESAKRFVRTSSEERVKQVEIYVAGMRDENARAPTFDERHERPIKRATLKIDLRDEDGRLQPCKLTLWSKVGDGWHKTIDALHLSPREPTPPLAPADYLMVVHTVDDRSKFVLPPESERDEFRVTLEAGRMLRIPLELSQLREREPPDTGAEVR